MFFYLTMGNSIAKNNNLNGSHKVPSVITSRENDAFVELQQQLLEKDELLTKKDKELDKLHCMLLMKEEENTKLSKRIHEFECVVAQTSSTLKMDESRQIQKEKLSFLGRSSLKWKRLAVSGESSSNIRRQESNLELQTITKDSSCRHLIRKAIYANDFLKNLEKFQVREIVSCMYPKKYNKDSFIIKEGETGDALFVLSDGTLEVSKDGNVLCEMSSGTVFGELAILYNCKRTASVRAKEHSRLWVIDRSVFKVIMMRTGITRLKEHRKFLKSVSLLSKLPEEKLTKMVDVLQEEIYDEGTVLIREGESGNTFFIIIEGMVKVTQTVNNSSVPQLVRTLKKGDYFGERALLSEDCRTANVIACAKGVSCLVLERNAFKELIGDLNELKIKDYGDEQRGAIRFAISSENLVNMSNISRNTPRCIAEHELNDFTVVTTLGIGGFGRVELVKSNKDRSTFAMKCLKKKHIVDTRQQDHTYSEKNILMECTSAFIAKLYKTFKDDKYVYMLLEVCLGGELWTLLRNKKKFDEIAARFYVASMVEAFSYLHGCGIVYRDLKPENILLDNNGFAKLVDFGFAKKIGFGDKTWTFCGTPEYVAPEIILNKGHDFSVDYWSLGIFVFELLTGQPPFTSNDAMKTYKIILRGMDCLEFPRTISKNSVQLIRRLCRDIPTERLGYQKNGPKDIKKHKWFQGFHWQGLLDQTIEPPHKPKLSSNVDTSNFDKYLPEKDIPPDEFSGWDEYF
ncbi:cGMP-dependent protein kinase 1-like [Xenia sp. Carnegie-2017]|uniref:cGMP-dependent protein kinase 1-like n=1 Tax=Xenia sp. Carnegie-2017 TaxID=2897299 RepID=UPI001F043218|nr:cGMP-dependent protein kinase 1-like [Xenia sp. Carnegie-2017]